MAGAGGFGQDPTEAIANQLTPQVDQGVAGVRKDKADVASEHPGDEQGEATSAAVDQGSEGAGAQTQPKLGAGGTSEVGDEPDEGEGDLPTPPGGGKAAAATAAAAPAAAHVALLMIFLNWMKTLFATLATVLSNLWSMLVALVMTAIKAVVGFFVGIGTGIASFVGGAISATAGAVGAFFGFLGSIVLAVGAVAGVVASNDAGKHDGLVEPCSTTVVQASAAMGDGSVDASVHTETNAQTVYSVLSAWGMPDENIAGILGNWSMESGIDPTGVEGIFDEPFRIGPKKQAAQEANFAGFVNYLGNEMSVRGLGLGQWTASRGQALLDYADAAGTDWYTLETQLGFMISDKEGSNATIIKDMISTSQGGPEEAAVHFHDAWERSADTSMDKRKSAASSWYAKMGGWGADQTLADSILAQANTSIEGADKAAVNKALSECVGSKLNVDNSTLATAASSYAWPFYEDSKGNDGTHLYVWLHEEIFPGDPYYASCDRSVSVGVRWSGSDDTFPKGGVSEQLRYVSVSDKWEEVDWGGDKDKLQPGDLLMRKHGGVSHIVMYVGPDVPVQVWGEGEYTPNAEIVSGSLNDRSPAMGQYYGTSTGHGSTMSSSTGLETYSAWRLTEPETSSIYDTIVPPSSATQGEGDTGRATTPR